MNRSVHSLDVYLLQRYTYSCTQDVLCGETKKWRDLLHAENHVIVIQRLRLVRQNESWETQKPGTALGLRAGMGGGEGGGGGGRRLTACRPRSLAKPPVLGALWPGARPPSADGWGAPGCWAASCWAFLQVSTDAQGLGAQLSPAAVTDVQPPLWLTPRQGACAAFQGRTILVPLLF